MKSVILTLILFITSSLLLHFKYITFKYYIILCFLMVVFVTLKLIFFHSKEENSRDKKMLKRLFPKCRNGSYEHYIFNEYVKIIDFVGQNKLDEYENLLSEELYNDYCNRKESYRVNHYKNVMKNFELVDFNINYLDKDLLNVNVIFKCYDYTLDRKKHIIRGYDNKKVKYEVELEFIRNDDNTILSSEQLISQS